MADTLVSFDDDFVPPLATSPLRAWRPLQAVRNPTPLPPDLSQFDPYSPQDDNARRGSSAAFNCPDTPLFMDRFKQSENERQQHELRVLELQREMERERHRFCLEKMQLERDLRELSLSRTSQTAERGRTKDIKVKSLEDGDDKICFIRGVF